MSKGIFELWLLDVSGSMQGSRFAILREMVKHYRARAPHVKLVTFATELEAIESAEDLDRVNCGGGTNLHLGLELAAREMCGRVVVFTDGEPHDEEMCFAAAANIPGIVSAVHCGSEDDRAGIRFCEKLSRDNGGQFVARDVLKGEALVCGEVREMLGLPSPIAL